MNTLPWNKKIETYTMEPLWLVTNSAKKDYFLQIARQAFANRDTISSTFLSLDNPVSLTHESLAQITRQRDDYYVTRKADGIRYILVLDMFDNQPVACMVNRAGDVYATAVRASKIRFTKRCVFDGELCFNNDRALFLVFNALVVNGKSLFTSSYHDRLEHCRRCFLAEPRADDTVHGLPPAIIDSAMESVRFVVKPTVLSSDLARLPAPLFRVDGLVFTPGSDSVRTGRNPRLLKWKEYNSVDVGFNALPDEHLELWWDDEVTGRQVPVRDRDYYLARDDNLSMMLHGFQLAHRMCPTLTFTGVMECGLQVCPTAPHVLHFAHIRHDKKTANTPLTVVRTIQTIRDNVTYDMIVSSLTRQSAGVQGGA
jgi:hypothetical protein